MATRDGAHPFMSRSKEVHFDRDEIAKKLMERGANNPCQRCGRTNFVVVDGFSNLPLQTDFDGSVVIGGPSIPITIVACSNCGAITPHALGALGLLPQVSKE